MQCVIIDATALSYVDAPGIKSLVAAQRELVANTVTVLLAGANGKPFFIFFLTSLLYPAYGMVGNLMLGNLILRHCIAHMLP